MVNHDDPHQRLGQAGVSHEELVEFFKSHVRAEIAGDLDATMAGVSQSPVYNVVPLFRVSGRTAVREMYRRTMEGRGTWGTEGLAVIDDRGVTHWGPDHCVHEFPLGNYPGHAGLVTLTIFDGLSILSENAYIFDPTVAKTYESYLGEDFSDIPGVERWPPPV